MLMRYCCSFACDQDTVFIMPADDQVKDERRQLIFNSSSFKQNERRERETWQSSTYVASTILTPPVTHRVAALSEVPLRQSTSRSLASSADATNKCSPPSWNERDVTGAFPRITAPMDGGFRTKSNVAIVHIPEYF